jgi:hypothetical protein
MSIILILPLNTIIGDYMKEEKPQQEDDEKK